MVSSVLLRVNWNGVNYNFEEGQDCTVEAAISGGG
jgi:hypothetical protein